MPCLLPAVLHFNAKIMKNFSSIIHLFVLAVLSLSPVTPAYAQIADNGPEAPKQAEAKSKIPQESAAGALSISTSEPKIEMVKLPSGISMGKYEVTVSQFAQFVSETGYSAGSSCWIYISGEWTEQNGRNWQNTGFNQDGNHPVVCVNYSDVQAYISWLNKQTGKHYRLPNEDEWYSACQASSDGSEYCGSNNIDAVAWYDENSGATTHPVGRKQPNAYGLYDMSGNVWEWTSSCYESDCSRRVDRGGSWYLKPTSVRADHRGWDDVSNRHVSLGFRLVQDP